MRFGKVLIYSFLLFVGCRDRHENLSTELSTFYKYYIVEEFKNNRDVHADTINKYYE